MPDESFQDKTEKATPKKKGEARRKGQVAKSRELSAVAILSAGALYLYFGGKGLTHTLGRMMEFVFLNIPSISSGDYDIVTLTGQSVEKFLGIIWPLLVVLAIIAMLSNLLQTGFIWSVEALAPKASKIDPIQGLKKIFSKRTLVEFAKSVGKVIIVGWAAFSTIKDEFDHLIPLIYQEQGQILSFLAQTALKVVTKCCWVLAIMAILDYIYQKWEFEQNLKMTKQEVKDELKQTEGDPQVKSRIRSLQREMARRRMMEEVPKADVVITNPTHLAVAIRYDMENMTAPMVVAKGANRVAFRIRELAEENRIPVVENKILAQNLYKLGMGDEIPPQLYQAVAEILAYIYDLKRENMRAGV